MLVKNTTLIRHQTDTSLASVIGYAVFIQHVYCQSLPATIAGGRVGQEPTHHLIYHHQPGLRRMA